MGSPLPRDKVVRALTENPLTDERLKQLLEVGRAIVSELDLETLLRRVLDAARDLTGARYAALGILNEDKSGLERFLHSGIDEKTRREIGPLPRGRGLLGRADSRSSPAAPAGRRSASALVRFSAGTPGDEELPRDPGAGARRSMGKPLSDREGGGAEFDETDEQVVVVLAAWSGVAIENARLYEGLDRHADELREGVARTRGEPPTSPGQSPAASSSTSSSS